jgi:formylglycine-generating enzyme required for sulfatase activity
MEGRMERPDPARLRISDQDRHKVSEVLRQAAGEGRIDLDELEERLEATYAAKTYAELVPITADLPAHHGLTPGASVVPHRAVPEVTGTAYSTSLAMMSETRRQGAWLVPEQHTAFSMMGSVHLDLREATFAAKEVTINAFSIMGDVTVVVNAHTRVVVDGVAVMAEFGESRSRVVAELTGDSPVVHVKGLALMAGVHVKRKAMPGESRRGITGRR